MGSDKWSFKQGSPAVVRAIVTLAAASPRPPRRDCRLPSPKLTGKAIEGAR